MARPRGSNETAFVIDEDRVAASVDGTYFAGLPGLWRPGVAVHPEAFGLSLEEFRDVVAALDLPIVETKVGEGTARRDFDDADGRLESAPSPVGGGAQAEAVPPEEPEGMTIGEDVEMANALLDAADVPTEEETE